MPFDIASALGSWAGRSRQPDTPGLIDHRSVLEAGVSRNQHQVEQWLDDIAVSDFDAIESNELSRHASLFSSSDNVYSDSTKLIDSISKSSALTAPTSLGQSAIDQSLPFISRYPYVSLVAIGIGGFALGALGVWSLRRYGALAACQHATTAPPRSFFSAAAIHRADASQVRSAVLDAIKPLAADHPGRVSYMVASPRDSALQTTGLPFYGSVVSSIMVYLSSPFRRLLAAFGPTKTDTTPPPATNSKEPPPDSVPRPAFARLDLPAAPAVPPLTPLQFPLHRSLSSRSRFGIDMPAFRAQHPSAPVNAVFENHTYTPFSSLVHRSATINYGLVPSERLHLIPSITCTPRVDALKTRAHHGQVDEICRSGYVWDILILGPLGLNPGGSEGVRWVQLIRTRQGETALEEETQVRKVKLEQQAKLEWLPFDVAQSTWVAQLSVKRQVGLGVHSDWIRVKIHEKEYVCQLIRHEHPPHRYRFRGEVIDGVNPIPVPKWLQDLPEKHIVEIDPLGDVSKYFVSAVSRPTVVAPKEIALGTENRLFSGSMTYPDIEPRQPRPPFYRLSADQHSLETWNNAVHIYHVYDPSNDDLIDASEVTSGRWGIDILKMESGDCEWADALVRLKRFDVGSLSVSGDSFDCQMHLTEAPRVHVWEFHTSLEIDSEIGVPVRIGLGAYNYRFKPSERGWLLCHPEFDQEMADMRYM